jgi:hypothetical protein
MIAAAHGQLEVVKRRIEDDEPTQAQNKDGLTAARIEERAGYNEIAALLTISRN